MPIRLADKLAETKTITVTWDDDTADVSYHPNVVTPALLEQVDEAGREDNLDVMGVLLEPVLDWWDVLDEKGKRIPVTRETIRNMPMPFLLKVQDAIQEDQNPPENRA